MAAMPEDKDPRARDDRAKGTLSLKNWGERPREMREEVANDVVVDCGWGRIIFGQTFDSPEALSRELMAEPPGERDLAMYVRDPHVILATEPQSLFLDPSHTFRLDFSRRKKTVHEDHAHPYRVRPATGDDREEINRIYRTRHMVPLRKGFLEHCGPSQPVTVLVAEGEEADGGLLGVVMGVDHHAAFHDFDNGSSLWALAVDPQAKTPGIGIGLVSALADHFEGKGRSFMDLSVLHDNDQAISLYETMGFERVPVYCVKKKNPINEPLFIGREPEEALNIYAKIIIDEARRRGIEVIVEDAEAGLFQLSLAGRTVSSRESLSDMTSAVALSRCDDKALTRRILSKAGLRVPDQARVDSADDAVAFFEKHGRIVVKPARGEQGHGVFVDLTSAESARKAYEECARLSDHVIAEQFIEGEDLRIIVIDGEVVAAAVRRPASVVGDGHHTVADLIDKQSRRREAATGGESSIPLDDETRRCVADEGRAMEDVPPSGESVRVRKTANLHSGGTIHDVTESLHPDLAKAAVRGAEALQIPVVGFDFMVAAHDQPDYWIIEANERPGLANHEPQPTAERFIDFLFPETIADWRPGKRSV